MQKPGKMLFEVIKASMSKAATNLYPFEKPFMPKNFRGRINFNSERCIGCKICMRDCPANVINIITVGEKRFAADFKNDHCLFCAQCVDSCPKDALSITDDFELAVLNRSAALKHFDAKPAPASAAPASPASS